MKNVFITYNNNSEIGENTALRMQTLSNLYGFSIFLPYRIGKSNISRETKERINNARFILAFSIGRYSKILKHEIEYALSKNKPIIIIRDKKEKNIFHFPDKSNVKEVLIDYYNTDEALHQISDFLEKQFNNIELKQKKNENAIGTALVGIGLGLLAYWALSDNN